MSSPTPPKQPRKELPNELRMLLAFVLMGLILVATPWVYKRLGISTPQQSAAIPSAVQSHKETPQPSVGASPASAPEQAVEGTIAESSERESIIDTNLYRIVFSNRGAVVKSWTLKNFKDSSNHPLELVNLKGAEKAGYPFSWDYRGQTPSS
ncbi:MAG: hypothetical protein M3N54_13300, partial [Acidobacteriota bacterium]|nr:hypothetical protein [Acidobacteriota bacterium]